MKKTTAVFVVLLSMALPSFGWGPEGHRIIGDVAARHLNAAARQRIRQLLGNEDLASVSTWADEIRRDRPETFRWHFVDIPRTANGFSEGRDCDHFDRLTGREDTHDCVVDRISIFEGILGDQHATRMQKLEALKFLVHFVADVHQPMHAIGDERGGNGIRVIQFGHTDCGERDCNLHAAWDLGLIEHTHLSESQYVHRIESLIGQQHLDRQGFGNPEDWANESFELARRVWLSDGAEIDERYYRENIGALDRQLALAGLRLAAVLNRALGK